MSSQESEKKKGMCIATRCTTVEQFIQMFHRFVDEDSFFVSTLNTRPPGLETSFSVQLADGTPVLRGLCVVQQAWTDTNNPFKTPGVRLGIKRLTANSMTVFERLLVTRSGTKPKSGTSGATPAPIPAVATKPIAGLVANTPAPAPPNPLAVVVKPKIGVIPTIVPPASISPKAGSAVKTAAAGPVVPPKSAASDVAKGAAIASALAAKSPVSEPAKSPVSEPVPAKPILPRLDLKQPRPETEGDAETAVPQHVAPEPTDVVDEKTDIREVKADPRGAKLDGRDSRPKLDGADARPKLEGRKLEDGDTSIPTPPPDETRTPGSDFVLPANPLMNLTDESLEGYVDCTLYEETGNFFPVDDETGLLIDDVVPPPPAFRPAVSRAPTPPPDEVRGRTITPVQVPPVRPSGAEITPLPTPPDRPSQPDVLGAGDVSVSDPIVKRDSVPSLKSSISAPRDASVVESLAAAAGPPSTIETAQGERVVATPHKRARPPWWLVGGVGALVAAVALVVVVTTSSSDGSNPAKPAPAQTSKTPTMPTPADKPAGQQAAQVAPPAGDNSATDDETDPPEDHGERMPGEGPPVVGSGPCKVAVFTTPAGSIVQLDGNSMGPSPITVAATCDKHKLDISHARYAPTSRLVTLTPDKPQNVDVTLSRPTHIVTVTSQPSGAQIFIDGRSAGTTPMKMSVLGFVTLKLEFKKTGYQTASSKLYSRVPQDTVSIKLMKW